MTSRKRRAPEPESSPRSYKQPRLSPQEQIAGLSQPSNGKETILTMCFSWCVEKIVTLVVVLSPVLSSPHISAEDESSDGEYTGEATPDRSISPEGLRIESHEIVGSTSRNNFSTFDEISSSFPFHGPGFGSQSTPKGHHGTSSSLTTTYSNTQPPSNIELLVEDVNNIRFDSTHSSLQSSQITGSSFSRGSTAQSKETIRKTRFRPHSKTHIRHREFKASVRQHNREALKLRMYQVMKHHRRLVDGHVKGVNFSDFQLLLRGLGVDKGHHTSKSLQMPHFYIESGICIKRTIANAKATLNSPKPSSFTPAEDQRKVLDRKKDADIEARLRGFPDHLPPKEEEEVDAILRKRGVVAKFAREQVSDVDVSRLRPGYWLNDEIINFYGAMISARSESNKENAQVVGSGGANGSLDAYYFSTFFWAKLSQDGYEGGRLAKWTKKINIFSKDVILIPVNHSNAHWTAAAINFRKKRIESYDSMGMAKRVVFTHLRAYLDAEHRDKRKKPFDFTGWVDFAPENTPQQENGWDCGVFTCHFLEAVSRGEQQFAFSQAQMQYLRRRMIWEIGNATLRKADYK